jgi:hypothetical protein
VRGRAFQLVALLQDVRAADGYRYGTTDDQGVGMDTAKIVPGPPGTGYLAVHHHLIGGVFNVRLATSTDLLHWRYVATLENDASQPTIAELSGGGFLWRTRRRATPSEGATLTARLEAKVHQRVNVRVLELIDPESGSRIQLEGMRLPITHSKDVIQELT